MTSSTCGLCSLVLLLGSAFVRGQHSAVARHLQEGLLKPGGGSESHLERFLAYAKQHGRTFQPNDAEFPQRLQLFQRRLEEINAHNSRPGRTWTATVNSLTDRTREELQRLRGYKRPAPVFSAGASLERQKHGLLSQAVRSIDFSQLPTNWSWVGRLKAMHDVRDQGGCGSCWAFASSTVLRAHAELFQRDRTFSVQQMVSCTPNRRQCGGTGGCDGATAELALDYVARVGAATEGEMPYDSKDGICPANMELPKPTLRSLLRERVSLADVAKGGSTFGMLGWRKLPENKMEPLILALYEEGPVAVSLMANDRWNSYGGGVLDACDDTETEINHAVTLVGFGEDKGLQYWQVQNSWGREWGERGLVRLLRRDGWDEAARCTWDRKPELGTGCIGGPSEVYVCGSCGILYDSVVPQFQLSRDGWWAKNGGQHRVPGR